MPRKKITPFNKSTENKIAVYVNEMTIWWKKNIYIVNNKNDDSPHLDKSIEGLFMNITEKRIKETEAKTYAYLSSVAIGFLIAEILLLIYYFLEYLTDHTNEENYVEELHYDVDLNGLLVLGCLGVILILMLFFLLRFWIRKIKCIEKRLSAIIISGVLTISLLPVWGYLSILIWSIIGL